MIIHSALLRENTKIKQKKIKYIEKKRQYINTLQIHSLFIYNNYRSRIEL